MTRAADVHLSLRLQPSPQLPSFENERPASAHLGSSLGDSRVGTYADVQLPPDLRPGSAAHSTVHDALEELINDFHRRPSKKFRSHLVEAGFLLALGQNADALSRQVSAVEIELCHSLGESLEAIHAGSLIIDDIQDQSAERRGSPTLHKKFGVPLALNAGNWLYFRSFELIRDLVSTAQIESSTELRLYRLCHQVMLNAHVGQAIDLGACISEVPRKHVMEICLASLRLKTGALMALALGAGAVLAGANDGILDEVLRMGHELGVTLQMFDDLGNIQLQANDPKRFEDLYLNRPSWIWAAAAQNSTDGDYKEFLSAVRILPDELRLREWFQSTDLLPRARRQAFRYSSEMMSRYQNYFFRCAPESSPVNHHGAQAMRIMQSLLERIQESYG